MSKTVEKLEKLADERAVVLLLPAVPTLGPEEDGMKEYFTKKISAIPRVKSINMGDDVEYEGNHPTEAGTTAIINTLHDQIGGLILDEAEGEVTTKRWYTEVESTYKVGCRGCDTPQYTPHLCDTCQDEAAAFDTAELDAIIERIEEELFPSLSGVSIAEEASGITNKREREPGSESDGEGNEQNKKPLIDGSGDEGSTSENDGENMVVTPSDDVV